MLLFLCVSQFGNVTTVVQGYGKDDGYGQGGIIVSHLCDRIGEERAIPWRASSPWKEIQIFLHGNVYECLDETLSTTWHLTQILTAKPCGHVSSKRSDSDPLWNIALCALFV